MAVTAVTIRKFKAIDELRLELKRISVLAGGNNAGKSCALQAIHFAVGLAQTAKAEGAANFAPEKLRYAPTDLFTDLKHKERLSESGAPVQVEFEVSEQGVSQTFSVSLWRGRNSTISTVAPSSLATGLGAALASSERPYSVYVPGLAGIPSRETYQGRLVVDRGAVRGDANLYLRNVLHRLSRDPVKKAKFLERLARVFEGLEILADDYDENRHEHIPVGFKRSGVMRPLDMIGTGALQAIQILGYVSFYQPTLLLLDEPDAHLHPNNQIKLVETLGLLSQEENLQIVLATHSRHLLQAMHAIDDVASFHLKDGALVGTDPALSELLVDLGAVDKYDTLGLRDKDWLILGEDGAAESDPDHPLRVLLSCAGVDLARTIVMSFHGCTETRSVSLLASFIAAHHPTVKILVHRDRDFMTDEEVDRLVVSRFSHMSNVSVYITEGADVEASFVTADHIAAVCGLEIVEAQSLIESVALANHNNIVTRFNAKRAALHKQFGQSDLEGTERMRSEAIPLPPSQRVGKDMAKWLFRRLTAERKLPRGGSLFQASSVLTTPALDRILAQSR
jgi:hypothetical protein